MSEHTLAVLAEMADRADQQCGRPGHSRRVAAYTEHILAALAIDGQQARTVLTAARLHDIGTLGLSETILAKPAAPTGDEWALLRAHPQRGADYLSGAAELSEVCPIVLRHHERIDGRGYPHALRGAEIPLGARIVAVAEGYDAMTSDQPYRRGLSVIQAKSLLTQGAGTQWDRMVVVAFLDEALPRVREAAASAATTPPDATEQCAGYDGERQAADNAVA